MVDEILGWIWIALAICSAMLGLLAYCKRRRGACRRCAGPATRIRRAIDPRWWFVRGTCWYDLTGLPVDAIGFVRCPECGHEARLARAPKNGSRFRWPAFCIAVLTAAIAIFSASWMRGGTWVRPMPMAVLALMDRSKSKELGRTVREEVDRRIGQGEFTPWSTALLLQSLRQDLFDDDRHYNAERAIDLLEKLWPQSQAELERCLSSGDPQARLLAAQILRRLCNTPSPELLAACMEDLRQDEHEVRWYLSRGNARQACNYLLQHAGAAQELLANALQSEDPQQRLLAAAVIGYDGRCALIHQAAPILIEHLRDNDIEGDAKVAAPALFRFGRAALPYLSPHVDSEDPQLRAAARSIIEQLEHPNRTIHRLQNPMPRLTVLTDDPLNSLPLLDATKDLSWP